MKNGGYKIIDFKDVNLTNGIGTYIKGIYEAIENNHRKTYLLSGLTLAGTEKADIFCNPTVANGNFVFSDVYGNPLTVGSTDYVTWGTKSEESPES